MTRIRFLFFLLLLLWPRVSLTAVGQLCGSITATSGVANSTVEVSSGGTVYITPDLCNRLAFYSGTGSNWTETLYTETSGSVGTLSGTNPYDLFVYRSGTGVAIEKSAAWSNGSTRTDALVLQDGVAVKGSNKTRLYVATLVWNTDTSQWTIKPNYLTTTDHVASRNPPTGGGTGFTGVAVDAPLAGLGTSASHLAMPAATNSVDGYLTSADHTTFAAKQSVLTFSQSITNTAGSVKLTNDTASPGNSKYYGTDSGGTRGYFDLPDTGSPPVNFTGLADVPNTYSGAADYFVKVKGDATGLQFVAPPAGSGDVTGPAASVDSELPLFSGTSGKVLKRETRSGIPHLTDGVVSSVGSILTADIANDAVTFAVMQNVPTGSILCRTTASTGDIETCTAGTGLSLSSGVLSNSGVLGPGTNSADFLPQWNGANSKTLKNGLAVSTTPGASTVVQADGTGKIATGWIPTLNQNTTGNADTATLAATATALAVNPTPCSAGQFVTDIAANGTLTCSTPAGSGDVLGPATNSADFVPQWNGANSKTLKNGLAVSNLNTASALVQRDASGNFSANTITANLTGNVTGNASTATALAANGTNCSNQFPRGSDASGNAEGCASVASTDVASGSKEGDSTKFQMFTGADPNTGNVAVYDANHNLIDGGTPPLTMAGSNTECLRNNAGLIGSITGCTSNGTSTVFTDGTLRATNPWITGAFDSNGNPAIRITSTSSAVNGIEIVNAAAGNPATVIMRPFGASLNINLLLQGLGTGSVCAKSCDGAGSLAMGSLVLNGSSSGAITIQPQAAAGTYNFNLPITAGTSGYFLTSGGGSSSPMTWTQNNFLTAIPASPEVDGHADATLSAANCTDTVVYNTGQAAADVALTLPTAASGLSCLFTVGTARSNKWGVRAAASDKIYLLNSDGTISAGSDNGFARMTNAQIGQSFACWTFKTDAYDWQCKAIAVGTSTFAAN